MCYSVLVEEDLHKLALGFDFQVDQAAFDRLYHLQSQNPKIKTPAAGRIFPGSYAPVLMADQNGHKRVRPMRYGAYQPSYLPAASARGLSTFNARRDSLDKRFWSEAFMHHHGILGIYGFYEWVAVKDLLAAGVVTREAIAATFEQQKRDRIQKWLEQGKDPKKLKPTATERKDLLERSIVISFRPDGQPLMVLPVICSPEPGGQDWGFAVLTNEPNQEIRQAGHDRMPIQIQAAAALDWLEAPKKGRSFALSLLDHPVEAFYHHHLPESLAS